MYHISALELPNCLQFAHELLTAGRDSGSNFRNPTLKPILDRALQAELERPSMESIQNVPNVQSSSSPMILIVGDGNTLADSFQDALVFGGDRVLHAESGHDARAMLRTCRPDLVVLELMLPDADGLVLLDDLRNLTRVPVLVCSDTRRKQDRVLALRLGAQEFLAQPVTSDELRTCVRAVLERTPASRADGRHPELLRFGDLVIDQTRRSISLRDRPVHVTPTEYRLLHALGSRPCQVLTYDELVRLVWQYRDSSRATHMMHSHMSRLRAKLEGCRDAAIVAVRGFGYMLDVAEKHRTTRPGDVDLNLV